ncbi:hypothetical protein WG66_013033 [Moniliophthora roreri]|nr:hypothetical protein WG66_013033 [Moniliophthora roreri]
MATERRATGEAELKLRGRPAPAFSKVELESLRVEVNE